MRSEYLLFNAIVVFLPLIAAVGYKGFVFPELRKSLFAVIPVSTIFILVDVFVVNRWWVFNPLYTLGLYFWDLPIEEILFFFTVSWACLVVYVNALKMFKKSISFIWMKRLCILLCFGMLLGFWKREYTSTVFLLLALMVGIHSWKKIQAAEAFTYVFTLCAITIFNGYLTSRPVVLYDGSYISGWRIWTIPIEDYAYGILFIIGCIKIYSSSFWLKKKST